MITRLDALEQRSQELERLLALPEVVGDPARLQSLGQEHSSLAEVVAKYRRYRQVMRDLAQARDILRQEGDEELRALARQELATLEPQQGPLEQELRIALLPRDPADERDVIVEVRAGAGGEEAALFAAELFRMYQQYAQRHGWKVNPVEVNDTGLGGIKEVVFEVKGRGAYSRLKHESGVHRVQRVPSTESSGRIHTSTATVAVLPEAEEVDVKVAPDDLRVDFVHASGHGGQNVQKVSTAVRITHIPTGIVVVCQDERSQLQNRLKAMRVLMARIYDQERRRHEAEIAARRRAQVGTAERSEKVRTYNFPQNRVTDHRVDLTVHSLPQFMDGDLDELLDALAALEQTRRLEEVLATAPESPASGDSATAGAPVQP
ncbi:MAG: peptide chain release factor 1 [Chloroflexi bacterium]|nr:peptide chain release factor 1 [Chloroflexota bacterium]